MAKVQEEVLVIKFSRLVKSTDEGTGIIPEDVLGALEQVAQELVGNGIIVEVEKA